MTFIGVVLKIGMSIDRFKKNDLVYKWNFNARLFLLHHQILRKLSRFAKFLRFLDFSDFMYIFIDTNILFNFHFRLKHQNISSDF